MNQLSKPYDPKQVETNVYRRWERSGFFDPDQKREKQKKAKLKTYAITMPPPNITGSLHMGHALNAAAQDILIRWKRMRGHKTLWLPGTDHAGIATQNVVEKELRKSGITRHDIGREKFIEHIWEWRNKYGTIILEQLKRLGVSCDWSRTRFTMDAGYTDAVLRAFKHYFDKGWIYQGERVINWCTRCFTSLSDLELEYKTEKGKLWYIKYPLQEHGKTIIVATTRPETMLGDAAVAVNPRDKRYKNVVGKTVVLPFVNRVIPIVADSLVEQKFGTGAVKVTPNHDLADFEIAERHNLSRHQIIDEHGKMTKEAGMICEGLSVFECREKILNELEKNGYLEKTEIYEHRVSKCYRCDTTVEPLLSTQWFLKMGELAEIAIRAVKNGDVRFHPKRWRKVYLDWLTHTRDWCISRQLWWGHRIPVWYCANSSSAEGGVEELSIHRSSRGAKADQTHFVSLKPPKKCPMCNTCVPKQSEDVLDTWFSSALWPFATLGWPKKSRDLKMYYPTQVLMTDRGIINLWVGRMVFSSYELLGTRPFRDVFIHATVLTREGKRMSKSLGTGIDPLDLVDKYGADATRFGLIWQAMGGQDIRFAEEHFVAGKKFCNKMWNATRFVLTQIESKKGGERRNKKLQLEGKPPTSEERKLLQQLDRIAAATNNDLEKFRLGRALRRLYDFFWHTYCDQYIEYSKSNPSKDTHAVLLHGLVVSLTLLHPFIPFITEELYQQLPIQNKKLLLVKEWPK